MSSKLGTRKITATQMVELERIFQGESEDADGLDMDQFVKVFLSVLGGINDENEDRMNIEPVIDEEEEANSKRYLTHLFMKIDANSDGTVDWEEFLNFLLLENQGLESSNFDQQRDLLVRETMHCDNYHSNHSNMISSILHFPNQSRYVSGSLDGTIKLWDTSTFQIKKTILNSPNNSWVMDLAYLPLSHQIAAISMDGIINVYSAASWKLNSQFMNKGYVLGENYGDSKKFNKEEQRWIITSTPVCGTGSILHGVNNELLCIGTESGAAYLYVLNNNNNDCEECVDELANVDCGFHFHICSGDQSLAPNQISIKNKMYINNDQNEEEIIRPILSCSHVQPFRSGVTPHIMDIHNDWITHIKYNEDLQSLVTSSLDSQIRFSDIERRKKTRIYMGHMRGVHSFGYNREYKFMASCGVERKIHIFDAHRCARLQLLVGHNTSISDILMNEARHQIISLSFDKVMKVWDTRTFRCLQTLHDEVGYQPDNRISALLFDSEHKRLITCSSRLQSWCIRFETKKSLFKSHDDSVSAAYFNKHFEQCVSSDFTGNIHVWDITDSSRVFKYATNASCTKKEKVTALVFDKSQRRVITGSDVGTLKMWNFSSGQCLCEFRDNDCKYAHWLPRKSDGQEERVVGTEITGIVYVMEVTSWNEKDVQHWFESFRDKQLRNVCNIITNINGNDLLELNHHILHNKYGVRDVVFRRKILTAISSLYQSNIASRYIVSVGWDNKIKVWIDSTNNKKAMQHPITVMQSNQVEILCIAHYPPYYVVTGGSDGSIAICNVVSGHFQRKEMYPQCAMYKNSDTSCCTVSWLSGQLKLIVTGHSNGTLIFWNPNNKNKEQQQSSRCSSGSIVLGFRHTAHRKFGGINCMVTAKKSSIIVTTDNSSMLQIFDLSQLIANVEEIILNEASNLKEYIKRLNVWCTGHKHITCIDYLDSKDLILTSGDDGEIILWNTKGFKIGMFGEMSYNKLSRNNDAIPKLWNLNDANTFIDNKGSSRSQMDTISDIDDAQTEMSKNKKNKKKKHNNHGHIDEDDDDDDAGDGDNVVDIDGIMISNDTFKLINNNNNKNNENQNDDALLLSSPELHAILEKPSSRFLQEENKKMKKKNKTNNILQSVLMRRLQTFNLDDIPKESPFK